jgi:DNA-binding transcriptional MerR regulator
MRSSSRSEAKPAVASRFHIGTLAERSGRSVHTIRWYEKEGLLPLVGRDSGGRRVYEDGHVEHLLFLEWLRLTGMSTAEMKRFTELALRGWKTIEQRRALLSEHRAVVEQRMRDLKIALDLIDAKTAYFVEWAARKKRPPPMPMPEVARLHSEREPRGKRRK